MPTRTKHKIARRKSDRASDLPISKALKPGVLTEEDTRAICEETLELFRQSLAAVVEAARMSRVLGNCQQAETLGRWSDQGEKYIEAQINEAPKSLQDQQKEGARFRQDFMDMTPIEANNYLRTHRVDVWWLAGFSGDPELIKRMKEIASRPRPGARRGRKWNEEVRAVAEKAYREWIDSANKPHPAWRTSWGAFAKACIDLIKRKTGADVPEDALRRSILPARKFPRPE